MPTFPQLRFQLPEGTTQITLVRHGQTQPADPDNPFPLKDGHGDPLLTERGHAQAAAVGDRLADEPIDMICVSSLTRTHETAAPLAAKLGLEPVEIADLREIFLGDWEGGLFRQKAEEGHPAVLAMREKGDWGELPGAESNAELVARTTGAIADLHANHRGKHIVCFVHGGVVAAIVSYAVGATLWRFMGSDNGAIHRLGIHDERWMLRGYNDINHLVTAGVQTPAGPVDKLA